MGSDVQIETPGRSTREGDIFCHPSVQLQNLLIMSSGKSGPIHKVLKLFSFSRNIFNHFDKLIAFSLAALTVLGVYFLNKTTISSPWLN